MAVVVVTWNSARFIEDCLASVFDLEMPPREIVVVDSGSVDGTAELVRERFPTVRLIECGGNIGYCRANNLGFTETTSPYVLVLNPDTKLTPGFLGELLPAFEDPKVGIVSGKLLRFDERHLDSAGQELGRSRQPLDRGYGDLDEGQFSRPVRSSIGIHIVRLDERDSTSHEPLEGLAEEIKQRLYDAALEDRYNRWLREDLRARHHVEIHP